MSLGIAALILVLLAAKWERLDDTVKLCLMTLLVLLALHWLGTQSTQ